MQAVRAQHVLGLERRRTRVSRHPTSVGVVLILRSEARGDIGVNVLAIMHLDIDCQTPLTSIVTLVHVQDSRSFNIVSVCVHVSMTTPRGQESHEW